jgi:hypothetical protein
MYFLLKKFWFFGALRPTDAERENQNRKSVWNLFLPAGKAGGTGKSMKIFMGNRFDQ